MESETRLTGADWRDLRHCRLGLERRAAGKLLDGLGAKRKVARAPHRGRLIRIDPTPNRVAELGLEPCRSAGRVVLGSPCGPRPGTEL